MIIENLKETTIVFFVIVVSMFYNHTYGLSLSRTIVTDSVYYEATYLNRTSDIVWLWISDTIPIRGDKEEIKHFFFNDFKYNPQKEWLYYLGYKFAPFGDSLTEDNFVVRIPPHAEFKFVSDKKDEIDSLTKSIVVVSENEVLRLYRMLATILDPPTIFYDKTSIFVETIKPIKLRRKTE